MKEIMKRFTFGWGAFALMGLVAETTFAQSWVPAGGGTWNDITSWTPGTIPDSGTAQIVFTKNYAAAPIFTLDREAPFTVNKITYNDNTTAYFSGTISPGSPAGSLIFAGTTPTIDTPAASGNAADLIITAPVDLTLGLTKTGTRSVTFNGGITLAATPTLAVNGGTMIIGTALTLNNGLTKTGAGILTLNGAVTPVPSGALAANIYNNVTGGTLAIGAATPIDWTTINKTTGDGILRVDALTTLTAPATFSVGAGTLQLNPASGTFGFDASGFTKTGNGKLDFLTLATGPGGSATLQINAGKVSFAKDLSGFASATVTTGATLQFTSPSNATLNNTVPLALNGNGSAYTLEFPLNNTVAYNMNSNIVISGDVIIRAYGLINTYNFKNAITSSGANSLYFRSEGGNQNVNDHTFNLNAASTYTGNTTFNAISQSGILKLGIANALPVTTSLNLIGGGNANTHAYFEMNGKNQTLAGLTATPNAGGAVVKNSGATATLTLNTSSDSTMAGQLTGNIALTKTGPATFALTGANTYTGITTINEGTLQVGNGGTAGTLGSGIVSNLATLVFNRSDTVTLTNSVEGSGNIVVSSGTLKLSPMPVPISLVNAGFELPIYGPGLWAYLTSDGVTGGWTFNAAGGGIARSGSTWVGTAPEGLQAAFLQSSSYVSQNINLPSTASYSLSFAMANRPAKNAGDLALVIDGVTNKTWTAAEINNSGVFRNFSVDLGEMTAGAHTLKFAGWSSDATDRATDIDNVQIARVSGMRPGPLSSSAQVSLASSAATLELDGANQTLAGLSGSGLVTNSAVTAATLTIGNDSDSTFGGVIGGNITLNKTGTGTWSLAGLNSYSGATQIEGGTLQLAPALGSVTVSNNSFETHDPLTSGNWGYNPTGATWIFSVGNSGIATADGTWVAKGTTLDGTKAGFIQRIGTLSNTVVVVDAGWYTISFLAGKRPGFPATQLFVEVDGATQFQLATSAFVEAGGSFSGIAFLSSGAHTLTFRGYSSTDAATWIDRVQIASNGGKLPAGTPASLAEGTTLDLGGNAQALAGLSGSGLVTNGTLSITGTIAPGGAGALGTLTIPGGATLSGTLLIDLATDGSCDLLQVQGSLDVSSLDLQIQDLGQLGTGKQYVIARCTPGGLSGRFLSTNLRNLKSVQYDNASGEVRLIGRGTIITIY
jgi:autotransporter-associated beta strand protein